MNRRFSSKRNGKKGGRPAADSSLQAEIPEFSTVVLTPNQYYTLIIKYGNPLLKKALSILQDWLLSSPEGEKYRGKNNYGHFRSDGWVINAAKCE